jgi:hypothetical protein
MEKVCPNCGENTPDDKFCEHCGIALPVTSAADQLPVSQPAPIQQPVQPVWYIPPPTNKETEIAAVHTSAQQPQGSATERTTKKRSTVEWVAICGGVIILLIIIVSIIGYAVLGASSSNPPRTTYATQSAVTSVSGDTAALAKMTEMNAWMTPPLQVFGDAAGSQDTVKIRINAALLRTYIDQNLPEMRQLAAGATTKKSAAQEYIAFLEDLRTALDLYVQAVDKINSGDIDGGTDLVFEGNTYLEKAQGHILQVNALRE